MAARRQRGRQLPSSTPSSTWTRRDLQHLVSACFPVYSDHKAFTRLWSHLVDACGHSAPDGVHLTDSAALLSALQLDTQQRLLKDSASVLQRPLSVSLASQHERAPSAASEPAASEAANELSVSTQSLHMGVGVTSPRLRPSSSLGAGGKPPSPPAGVLDDVFTTDVLKKSQNWLGRWRTRYLFLRWNELEMCTKNQSVSRQHSAGTSLAGAPGVLALPPPPQQRSASLGTVSLPSADAVAGAASSSSTSSSAVRSKRYALQNLMSIQLMQLSESDPAKRLAVNLHFKQPIQTPPSSAGSNSSASGSAGGGYTTKSLILASERGPDSLRYVVRQLATMALLQALVAGAPAQRIRMLLQAGASLDAGYASVPNLSNLGLLQLPAIFVLQIAVARHLQLAATSTPTDSSDSVLKELQGADPRCLLHWAFASRALFASDEYAQPSARGHAARRLLFRLWHDPSSSTPAISTDTHAWSLLMYLCWRGDLESVEHHLAFLQSAASAAQRPQFVRYLEHTNGAGDTAIHLAIKAASAAAVISPEHSTHGEEIALRLVDAAAAAMPCRETSAATDPVAVLLAGDASGETALHLALKARMWRLAERLLSLEAMDPAASDAFRNNALHLSIKVAAPSRLIAHIVSLGGGHGLQSPHSPRGLVVQRLIEERERLHNDTPLTLAIKAKRDDVVEFLLSEGHARADVDGVVWQRDAAAAAERLLDGESPLAAAIKTGQQRVALLLLQHGADYRRCAAAVLSLAIRFGMYGVAMDILARMETPQEANDGADERAAWRRQWVDPDSGELLLMLALRAQQLELAALLADAASKHVGASWMLSWRQDATNSTLLHALCLAATRYPSGIAAETNSHDDGQASPASPTASGSQRGRRRGKSRSDSDLFMEVALQAVHGGGVAPLPATDAELATQRAFHAYALENLVCRVVQCLGQQAAPVIMTPGYLAGQHRERGRRASCCKAESSPGTRIVGYSPLHLAACARQPELLVLLTAAVASDSPATCVNALQLHAPGSNETPLHAALLHGATENALTLLLSLQTHSSGCSRPSSLSSFEEGLLDSGDTLVHLASRYPRDHASLALLHELFSTGVYGNAWNSAGWAPLHVAIRHGGGARVVELFAAHQQDLNAWSERHVEIHCASTDANQSTATCPVTPLMCAIDCGNVEAARALVSRGADVRIVTPRNRLGLLHLAARRLAPGTSWPGVCRCQEPRDDMHPSRRELIDWLLSLETLRARRHVDALGMSTAEAIEALEKQRQEAAHAPSSPLVGSHRSPPLSTSERDDHEVVLAIKLVDLTAPSRAFQRSATTSPPRSPSTPTAGRRRPLTMPPRSSTPPRSPVRSPVCQPARSPPRTPVVVTKDFPRGRPASFVIGSKTGTSGARPGTRRGRSSERQLAATMATSPAMSMSPFHAPQRGLDETTLEFLQSEEKATLTLVAQQAKLEAQDWLKKRIGQKKLLSEARAQLQSLQRHRRTNSGNTVVLLDDSDRELVAALDHSLTSDLAATMSAGDDLLEHYKALAAKKFVDKHVSECVAEAKLEIEREKQHLLQTMGIYPGVLQESARPKGEDLMDRRLSRTGSLSGSMLLAMAPLSPTSRTFGGDDWSDTDSTGRGANGTFVDDNLTWLSTISSLRGSHLSSAFVSTSEPAGSRRQDGAPATRQDSPSRASDAVLSPLDRPSFVHVVESRRTLS
ncbi:hypothetical protein P43SY_000895 [Pythium insidiosum]|uniref:Uncharacterized protein n=1 Tax=Pythium insidiosum TaxID=114742 RepID=A0AAD5LGM9_PYTIN|nr:hypothetical protein P43SY_000895 [Pythium insidiosum]